MAVTIVPSGLTSGPKIIKDADCDSTAEVDLNGGSGTIYSVVVDNTNNAAEAEYVKIYNHANPVVGTTTPHVILYAAANKSLVYTFVGGLTLSTSISIACVQEAGTTGTTDPTSDTLVGMVTV